MRSSAASTPPVRPLCRPPTRFSPSGVSFDDAITMLDGQNFYRIEMPSGANFEVVAEETYEQSCQGDQKRSFFKREGYTVGVVFKSTDVVWRIRDGLAKDWSVAGSLA